MNQICGVDEAGRGPTAGPVTAGAVILPHDFPVEILKDSKQLSEKKRTTAARIIMDQAAWATGWAWPEEIDSINIHHAVLLAMKRAFEELVSKLPPEGFEASSCMVLVDGLFTPSLPCPCRAIVRGDSRIPEIMAASIIAKTMRDLWMVRYSWIERDYLFEKHKGYPTKEHREICRRLGPSPIHRLSFRLF
ncbi:MAG: ribonuclease HII [Spirochaetales bacterium]|nr:MAG: ribonuclease HII [Spirochaetales bacterium]